jgi:hypothetical protein
MKPYMGFIFRLEDNIIIYVEREIECGGVDRFNCSSNDDLL